MYIKKSVNNNVLLNVKYKRSTGLPLTGRE